MAFAAMWLLFLDEFGHPDLSQPETHHPAFGYAGILVRAADFDRLSELFLTIKGYALLGELSATEGPHGGRFRVGRLGQKKFMKLIREKKSRIFLQNGSLESGEKSFRTTLPHKSTVRFFNCIKRANAEIFLYGIEKMSLVSGGDGKAPALILSMLEDLIDKIVLEAKDKKDEIVIFFDQHSSDPSRARIMQEWIDKNKYNRFIRKSPAFSVSTWSQGIQVADWICFLSGKILGQYCKNARVEHSNYRKEYESLFFELMSTRSSFFASDFGEIRTTRHEQLNLPLSKR